MEVAVYTVGTIGIFQLYGGQFAKIYAVIVLVDLGLVYLLRLLFNRSGQLNETL